MISFNEIIELLNEYETENKYIRKKIKMRSLTQEENKNLSNARKKHARIIKFEQLFQGKQ